MKILNVPYTDKEIFQQMNFYGKIEGIISLDMPFSELMEYSDNDIDCILSEKIIGNDALENIKYIMVSTTEENCIVKVSGIAEYMEEEETFERFTKKTKRLE